MIDDCGHSAVVLSWPIDRNGPGAFDVAGEARSRGFDVAADASATPSHATGSTSCVLVAMPPSTERAALVSALLEADMEVLVAEQESEMHGAMAVEQPACVVFDQALAAPGNVLERLRAGCGRAGTVPLILLTSPALPTAAIAGFRAGADVCLPCAIDPGAVVRQAKALISMRERFRSGPRKRVRPAHAIQGSLDQVAIPTLLTVLELEGKTGAFEVSSGSRTARLHIDAGRAHAAAIDGTPVAPLAALREMLALRAGRFSFAPEAGGDDHPAAPPIRSVLAEAVRLADEDAHFDTEWSLPPAPAPAAPAATLPSSPESPADAVVVRPILAVGEATPESAPKWFGKRTHRGLPGGSVRAHSSRRRFVPESPAASGLRWRPAAQVPAAAWVERPPPIAPDPLRAPRRPLAWIVAAALAAVVIAVALAVVFVDHGSEPGSAAEATRAAPRQQPATEHFATAPVAPGTGTGDSRGSADPAASETARPRDLQRAPSALPARRSDARESNPASKDPHEGVTSPGF